MEHTLEKMSVFKKEIVEIGMDHYASPIPTYHLSGCLVEANWLDGSRKARMYSIDLIRMMS